MLIAANSSFPPAHGTVFLKPLCRETVTVRICAGRGRAHRHLIRFVRAYAHNPVRNQSATRRRFLGGWIAAAHSLGSEVLARAIERTRTPIALARAVRRGQLLIYEFFCRNPTASGSPFTSPLLKHRQEPRSGFSNRFQFSPVLSFPAAHGSNHAAEGQPRSWEKHP